jgi:hypothetical protein
VKSAIIRRIGDRQIEIAITRESASFKWLFERQQEGFVLKN